MKPIVISLLIIVFYAIVLKSQIDTTTLNLYPLQDNNYWQYCEKTYESWPVPMSWYSYYTIEVIGDTILSNGKKYKILEKSPLDTLHSRLLIFERIDTSTYNVYRYNSFLSTKEFLVDSLKSQAGDTSQADRFNYGFGSFCDSVYDGIILNTQTMMKRIQIMDPLDTQYYILSHGLGFTDYYRDFDFGHTIVYLLYAVVERVEYGHPVNISSREKQGFISSIILYPNYPNPFNSLTTIEFYLDKAQFVELSVYSIDGRLIDKLISTILCPGIHRQTWNGHENSSGVYIYQLNVGKQVYQKKCLLLK